MSTPAEIIAIYTTEGAELLATLERHGYAIMQKIKWPRTIEHDSEEVVTK